jgi:hypothetical protein
MFMAKWWLIVLGAVFIIGAIIAYQIPLDVTIVGLQYSVTIPEGVALCDSEIEPFDKMPPDVARFCSEFKTVFMGIYVSGLLGAALIIIATVISGQRKKDS